MEVCKLKVTPVESSDPLHHKYQGSTSRRCNRRDSSAMERSQRDCRGDAEVRIALISVAAKSVTNHALRFYCWGPAKSPMDITANEVSKWHHGLQTPVIFNPHTPVEIDSKTIQHLDLNSVHSTPNSIEKNERVLILTPLRDASYYLAQYFDLLSLLTYPHHLIDLAFLVGDSSDDTMAVLSKELERIQENKKAAFRSVTIVEKNFGAKVSQSVEDRHGFAAQGPRRKTMGKARNFLLSAAMKADHSWVYWRDVDIKDSHPSIIEHFTAHDRDILVPSTLSAKYATVATLLTVWYRCMVPQV